jgi:hypothetical protein
MMKFQIYMYIYNVGADYRNIIRLRELHMFITELEEDTKSFSGLVGGN